MEINRKTLRLCLLSYNAKRKGLIPRSLGTVEEILRTGKIPRGMRSKSKDEDQGQLEIARVDEIFSQNGAS